MRNVLVMEMLQGGCDLVDVQRCPGWLTSWLSWGGVLRKEVSQGTLLVDLEKDVVAIIVFKVVDHADDSLIAEHPLQSRYLIFENGLVDVIGGFGDGLQLVNFA